MHSKKKTKNDVIRNHIELHAWIAWQNGATATYKCIRIVLDWA